MPRGKKKVVASAVEDTPVAAPSGEPVDQAVQDVVKDQVVETKGEFSKVKGSAGFYLVNKLGQRVSGEALSESEADHLLLGFARKL